MRRAHWLFLNLVGIPLLAACGSGSSSTPPPQIVVTVTPTSATVSPSQTQQFFDSVSNTSNTGVTWKVNGTAGGNATVGTINTTGLYTAPGVIPNPAQVAVSATSQADASKSASASVTIAQQVSVLVNPNPVIVQIFGTQQFAATVNGVSSNAVNWQVNGTTGGSQQFGFISSSGLYVAPSGAPTKATANGGSTTKGVTITITAISQANPSSAGSASVTIFPPNQNAQAAPILLGTSGGNARDITGNFCCSGTLGSLVTRGGTQYILSNTHVLAKSDIASNGDPISQPGLIEVNCDPSQTTTVANLSQFFNLETSPLPNIDAAIAQVVAGKVDAGGGILFLGSATDLNNVPVPGAPHAGSGVPPAVNMGVAKSGRSTGLTCSTVTSIRTITSVQYQKGCGSGATFTVNYTNQVGVLGGGFSAEGDSGSLIVTQSTADPVALLFAGSDTDTVGNPVSDVLKFFKSGTNNVTFVGDPSPTGHPVIGCTLPLRPASAMTTVPAAAALAAEILQKAIATRDAHGPELMAHPEVQAVGVGASYDNPAEPAILFFVTKGQPRTNIPMQVDGIRTRIIEGDLFAHRGALSAVESAELEKSAAPPQLVYTISDAEVTRAKVVHTARADELMKHPGTQGVGISSSVDSPGEAALMIFLIRGVPHDSIPPVIDGLRTRIRESSRFRAGFGDGEPHRSCSLPAAKSKRRALAQPKH